MSSPEVKVNLKERSRSVESKERTGKQSMGRKVANDAIAAKNQGMMGASVYYADEIVVNINFNF
nr:MAG: hypothetical protein 2 [Gammacarmovirus sp.]